VYGSPRTRQTALSFGEGPFGLPFEVVVGASANVGRIVTIRDHVKRKEKKLHDDWEIMREIGLETCASMRITHTDEDCS
jgi:hypothetical protein